MASGFDKDRDALARAALVNALLGGGKPREPALSSLLSPPRKPTTALGDLFASPPPTGVAPALSNFTAPGIGNLTNDPMLFGALGIAPPTRALPIPALPVQTKRKGFFSFHYDDIMRVNNVRNAWVLDHPNREFLRNFYDRSLWEATKLRSVEALKSLIRDGMKHSSAVCVLVGKGTYERRWVKYEIARAVVDGRGLFAVHINGLKHHQRGCSDPLGFNPLRLMGVGKSGGKYYLFENKRFLNAFGAIQDNWQRYADYTQPVNRPRYLTEPQEGFVVILSSCTDEHDYVAQNGRHHLGHWIDRAAQRAGR